MSTTVPPVPTGTNLALLVGSLIRSPELRPLPSGAVVLGLELSVRPPGGPVDTVNVAWYEPSAGAERWSAGEELLVTGRTRRRFFRVGGVTQSRTEVVASAVVPTRRAAAARRAAATAIGDLAPAVGHPR